MELMVDELAHFKYDAFTPSFIYGIKEQLTKAKEHANKLFGWGGLEGCARYERQKNYRKNHRARSVSIGYYGDTVNERMEKTQPDHPDDIYRRREIDYDDGKKDPGECSHIIWL